MTLDRSPLRFLDFRKFIIARFLFTFSIQMQFVVITWYVYQLTKDPLALGFIGLSEAIPAICLSLYAGQWVDRLEKHKAILILNSLFLCVAFLAFIISLMHTYGYINNSTCVYLFYFIVFLNGIKRSFMAPTYGSYWPTLLPKTEYAQASATNSTFWQLAAILGPIVGSFFIAKINILSCFGLIILLLFVAIFLFYSLPKAYPYAGEQLESAWLRIREGLVFVYSNKIMLGALLLDLFSVFFAGVEAMIPVYADQILHCGAVGYGWLRAAPAIGSFIMLAYLSIYPSRTNTGKKLLFAVACFGISTLIFGISTYFLLSFAMLFMSGVFDAFSVVVRGTINQLLTPDKMRGRVMAVSSMFISSSNELGAMESGFAAKVLGLVPSVIAGSIATFVFVTGITLGNKKLRDFEFESLGVDEKTS